MAPLNDEELRDLLEDMGHVDLEIHTRALVRAVEAYLRTLHERADPDERCSLCAMRDALEVFQTKP